MEYLIQTGHSDLAERLLAGGGATPADLPALRARALVWVAASEARQKLLRAAC